MSSSATVVPVNRLIDRLCVRLRVVVGISANRPSDLLTDRSRALLHADVGIGADRATDQLIRRSINRLMWCARGYARTSASALTDRAIGISLTIDRSIDVVRPRLQVDVGIGAARTSDQSIQQSIDRSI